MMKRIVLFAVAASLAAGSSALGQPGADIGTLGNSGRYQATDEMQTVAYPGYNRMARQVRQLNSYRAHVRLKMRGYRANRAQWREFSRISVDIDRINRRFRYTYYTPGELNGQIRFLRYRLRQLERSLRFRPNDVFIWGNLG